MAVVQAKYLPSLRSNWELDKINEKKNIVIKVHSIKALSAQCQCLFQVSINLIPNLHGCKIVQRKTHRDTQTVFKTIISFSSALTS